MTNMQGQCSKLFLVMRTDNNKLIGMKLKCIKHLLLSSAEAEV